MTTPELRKKLKSYHRYCDQIIKYNERTGASLKLPMLPDDCLEMICGAKTRSGQPCQKTNLQKNGRCKNHGGLSTGPKTLEGKRRSALNTGKTYEELLKAKL